MRLEVEAWGGRTPNRPTRAAARGAFDVRIRLVQGGRHRTWPQCLAVAIWLAIENRELCSLPGAGPCRARWPSVFSSSSRRPRESARHATETCKLKAEITLGEGFLAEKMSAAMPLPARCKERNRERAQRELADCAVGAVSDLVDEIERETGRRAPARKIRAGLRASGSNSIARDRRDPQQGERRGGGGAQPSPRPFGCARARVLLPRRGRDECGIRVPSR